MYNLSRLIYDYQRDVYESLDQNEIGPTLYAAPWFLTLFASQFPLGFVARVLGCSIHQSLISIFVSITSHIYTSRSSFYVILSKCSLLQIFCFWMVWKQSIRFDYDDYYIIYRMCIIMIDRIVDERVSRSISRY